MKSQHFLDLSRKMVELIEAERGVNIPLAPVLHKLNSTYSERCSGIMSRIKQAGKEADIFGSLKTGKPDQLVLVAEDCQARAEARLYALFLIDGYNVSVENEEAQGDDAEPLLHVVEIGREDDLGRPMFKDQKGRLYLEVDGIIHDTHDGEPGWPVQCTIQLLNTK